MEVDFKSDAGSVWHREEQGTAWVKETSSRRQRLWTVKASGRDRSIIKTRQTMLTIVCQGHFCFQYRSLMLESVLFGFGKVTGVMHELALSQAFHILRQTLHIISWEMESWMFQQYAKALASIPATNPATWTFSLVCVFVLC